jgi:hypothetical protein
VIKKILATLVVWGVFGYLFGRMVVAAGASTEGYALAAIIFAGGILFGIGLMFWAVMGTE